MFRFLVAVIVAGVLFWAGSTIQLGSRTFFGHVRAIWSTEEAQEMRKGVKEKAGPALEKVQRGIEAGYKEATSGAGDGGLDGDAGLDAGS